MQLTPKNRSIQRVFLHCSASDVPLHDDISVIRRWHIQRGFADVGYHFFIKSDGTVQKGRDIEAVPAAQENNNKGTIAICCHGLTTFTEAQFKSLRELCHAIRTNLPGVTFHGHCEVSAKTCPVFDYKAVLNLNAKGKML